MRSKNQLIIALCLCVWSLVSYFLLLRQATSSTTSTSNELYDGHSRERDLLTKINKLEADMRDEMHSHDQLVKKLLKIIHLKEKQQTPDVPRIVDIVHDDTMNVIDVNALPPPLPRPKVHQGQVTRLGEKHVEENVIFADESLKNAIDKTVYSVADNPAQVDAQLKQLTKEMLSTIDFKGPVIPILVFACNRISVRNCLDNLIQYRPNAKQFPIIVSQVSLHKRSIYTSLTNVLCTVVHSCA